MNADNSPTSQQQQLERLWSLFQSQQQQQQDPTPLGLTTNGVDSYARSLSQAFGFGLDASPTPLGGAARRSTNPTDAASNPALIARDQSRAVSDLERKAARAEERQRKAEWEERRRKGAGRPLPLGSLSTGFIRLEAEAQAQREEAESKSGLAPPSAVPLTPLPRPQTASASAFSSSSSSPSKKRAASSSESRPSSAPAPAPAPAPASASAPASAPGAVLRVVLPDSLGSIGTVSLEEQPAHGPLPARERLTHTSLRAALDLGEHGEEEREEGEGASLTGRMGAPVRGRREGGRSPPRNKLWVSVEAAPAQAQAQDENRSLRSLRFQQQQEQQGQGQQQGQSGRDKDREREEEAARRRLLRRLELQNSNDTTALEREALLSRRLEGSYSQQQQQLEPLTARSERSRG